MHVALRKAGHVSRLGGPFARPAPPLDLLLFRRSPRLIVATAAVCSAVLSAHSSDQLNQLAERIRLLPQHSQFGNDAVAMSSCATNLLLHGHNPYTDANIITCLW